MPPCCKNYWLNFESIRESNKMKLLWFVSTLEDTKFVKEFAKSFDGVINLFHLNYLTRLNMLGFSGASYYPVSPRKVRESNVDVSKTFNVLADRLTSVEASKAYASTLYVLQNKIENIEDYVFVIPSGRHVHHVAASQFAEKTNIKRIYINYSNFPGYTFFDPKGTDCLSSIFKNPSRLDELTSEKLNVQSTFDKFSRLKEAQKSIPQVASSGLSNSVKKAGFWVDTFLQKMTGFYGDRRLKLKVRSPEKEFHLEYDPVPTDQSFLFFPLQVSTDQQVLVNFDGGSIFNAIDQAVALAEKEGCLICVREHPAESKRNEVRQYLNITRKRFPCLRIVLESVPAMIDGCSEVITINSTVGLESRLKNKKVKFLGRSFYEKATDHQLANYLERYLVNVDYHEPKVDRDDVMKVLSIVEN